MEEMLDSSAMDDVSADQPLPSVEGSLEPDTISDQDTSAEEELECVNVDGFIAKELEDLMSQLCRPSLVEYKMPMEVGSNTVGFVPLEELLLEEEELQLKHHSM
jgi:hypothetical protein